MKLTRRVRFSSGHRYWRDELSEEENANLFGKWASRFNHGHNYILEAAFTGRINPRHGMAINIKVLDSILKERIVSKLDQRSINDEVQEFDGAVPTTENIALFAAGQLRELPSEVRLHSVRVYEDPLLFAETDGGGKVKVTRGYEFSASHRLHSGLLSQSENVDVFGKCNNPAGHGHNYELEVTVIGTPDERTGMVADIEEMDRIIHEEVVDRYDHKHLNADLPEFASENPTSEVLTRTIWQRLNGKLPAKLDKVLLRETPRNIFEYSGEDE